MKCPCDKCKIRFDGCKDSCLDFMLFKKQNPDYIEVYVPKKSLIDKIKDKIKKTT